MSRNTYKEVGDSWVDEEGNEYIIKDIQKNVVISESVDITVDDDE